MYTWVAIYVIKAISVKVNNYNNIKKRDKNKDDNYGGIILLTYPLKILQSSVNKRNNRGNGSNHEQYEIICQSPNNSSTQQSINKEFNLRK